MVNTVSYRCYRFNALFCSMSPYKARNGSKASVHWPVDLASPSVSSFFTLLFSGIHFEPGARRRILPTRLHDLKVIQLTSPNL